MTTDTENTQHTGLNILIIDDHASDLKITARAFEKAAVKNSVESCLSAETALQMLIERSGGLEENEDRLPDLILADIKMPRMDGIEFLEQIKNNAFLKQIPVIMFTSSKNKQDVKRSYRLGASGFIQKPVEYDVLAGYIEVFNRYWTQLNQLQRDRSCSTK
ncbi:MAG: response regulator [Candidatus Omnitrophica bacterium]|nr:response regulator [Candidatus Omnitrophota bacterium]